MKNSKWTGGVTLWLRSGLIYQMMYEKTTQITIKLNKISNN